MEIGGYIELDTYHLPMLHDNAIKLNCGRNALRYLVKARKIQKIWMPKFMCDSCNNILRKENVEIKYYSIDLNFKPKDFNLEENEWLYVVNFYGQLTNTYLSFLKKIFINLIVDNAQAYFQMPLKGIDTIYTCRKFFGVADGAILYTDAALDEELIQDESYERMHFLLGRYERNASEFYEEYVENNHFFANQPIKIMSRLTENLLHGIDYKFVEKQRTKNFNYFHKAFRDINQLNLIIPHGAFMYPLYIDNGDIIRKKLQKEKIYIPTLWPDVFNICNSDDLEYDMAKNILPLPVDQRYYLQDLSKVVNRIKWEIKG